MSTREDLIYEKIIAADKKAGVPATPKNDAFFFPTKNDVKIARKWLDREITTSDDHRTLAAALRLVADRVAVPAAYLKIVRKLEAPE